MVALAPAIPMPQPETTAPPMPRPALPVNDLRNLQQRHLSMLGVAAAQDRFHVVQTRALAAAGLHN